MAVKNWISWSIISIYTTTISYEDLQRNTIQIILNFSKFYQEYVSAVAYYAIVILVNDQLRV